jgi:predicted ATPase
MTRTRAARAAGGFVRQVRLDPNTDTGRYPFTLPVVQHLSRAGGLDLDRPVTFLVGDNGTGKSTLIEALSVAAGFNAEGGSQSLPVHHPTHRVELE